MAFIVDNILPFSIIPTDVVPIGAASRPLIQRWVTDLKAADSMYYKVPRINIQASADFEWELETAPNSNSFYLFGDSTSTDVKSGRLAFDAGKYYGLGLTGSDGLNKTWFTDGNLHKFKIVRAGGVFTVFIDGELDATWVSDTDVTFNGIGRKFAGTTTVPTFSGSFFKSKLTVPGFTMLNHDYNFDDEDGNLIDYSKPKPTQMLSNPTFVDFNDWGLDDGAQWSQADGTLTMIQSVDFRVARQSLSVGVGVTYTVSGQLFGDTGMFRIVDLTTNTLLLSLTSSTAQVVSGQFTAISGAVEIRCQGGDLLNSPVRLKSPSVKIWQGSSVNVTAADREKYTYSATPTPRWIGAEQYNSFSDLVEVTGDVTGTGRDVRFVSPTGSYVVAKFKPATYASKLMLTCDYNNMAGAIGFVNAAENVTYREIGTIDSGAVGFVVPALSGFSVKRARSVPTDFTLENISLKHVIEVTP